MTNTSSSDSDAGSNASASNTPIDPVAGKTIAEVLGEIVWLMTQDPAGRDMKVSEIERLVMPAILQRRFHIKYAQVPNVQRPGTTALQPVSVDIFATPPCRSGDINLLARFSVRLPTEIAPPKK